MENIILEIVAGSHSYGTNISSSDEDRRGIFCADAQSLITQHNYVDEVEGKEPDDFRLYELRKFSDLLLKQNPNIMEILWTDDLISVTDAGQLLRSHRAEFLSQQVAKTYVEYAMSQLRRIKGHNKMIMRPQSREAPQLKDQVSIRYNLTNNSAYNKKLPEDGFVMYAMHGHMNVAFSLEKFKSVFPEMNPNTKLFQGDGSPRVRIREELEQLKKSGVHPDILFDINRDVYKEKLEEWKKYWQWIEHRNPVRSQLEIDFGYDTKHAMHVMRLLRSGYEILTEGIVRVRRPDAKELLSIRAGEWKYEKLLEEVDIMQEKIKTIKSSLPETIDAQKLAEVTYEAYKLAWKPLKLRANP